MSLERIAAFLSFSLVLWYHPQKCIVKNMPRIQKPLLKYARHHRARLRTNVSQHSSSRETRRRKERATRPSLFWGGRRLRFVAMSSFRRWSFHPPPKTTSSPEEAFSSPAEDGVGRTAGRNVADRRPNEEDAAFISVSFFVVLLALPIVSVFFMCARYACERAALGREARRARARARAALRTQFAPSPLDATIADGNDVGQSEDREARGTFARGNNTVRAVVNASTIDRLADAVIAGANPGYRRISRRRRRRIFKTRTQ